MLDICKTSHFDTNLWKCREITGNNGRMIVRRATSNVLYWNTLVQDTKTQLYSYEYSKLHSRIKRTHSKYKTSTLCFDVRESRRSKAHTWAQATMTGKMSASTNARNCERAPSFEISCSRLPAPQNTCIKQLYFTSLECNLWTWMHLCYKPGVLSKLKNKLGVWLMSL